MKSFKFVGPFGALVALGMFGLSSVSAQQREPGGTAAIGAQTSAIVKAVDSEKRIVTLQTEDGDEVAVKCGKEVRNFDQIKVGDQVKAAAIGRMVVAVGKADASPSADEGAILARTPLGAKPGVIVARAEEVTAKVDAVDPAKNTVTLTGPAGKSETIEVSSDVDLSKVKKGDDVTFRVTKGVALWVTSATDAQPAAAKIDANGETGGFALAAATRTAVVEAIDREKRTVTLKAPDGKTRTIHLGKGAVNFDQIEVGDKVTATLAEEVAFAVTKAGAAPSADAAQVVALAPKGGKPGVMIADAVAITGQIKSIDADKRIITLAEADGTIRKFKAAPMVKLAELKEGDDVSMRVTQALAIVVEKPVEKP